MFYSCDMYKWRSLERPHSEIPQNISLVAVMDNGNSNPANSDIFRSWAGCTCTTETLQTINSEMISSRSVQCSQTYGGYKTQNSEHKWTFFVWWMSLNSPNRQMDKPLHIYQMWHSQQTRMCNLLFQGYSLFLIYSTWFKRIHIWRI